MFGMFGEESEDCTTLVEDIHLDNARDYMRLVSSGMKKDYKEPSHPKVDLDKHDDFEIFYGVQNDPNYLKFKEGMLGGFGSGGGGHARHDENHEYGFSGFGECPCKKNRMDGLGANYNLGPSYGSWPPGPRPEPYRWTANDGTTYTLVQLDGKWMYQSSKNKQLFITAANLYEMMGVKRDANTLAITGEVPGEHHPVEDVSTTKSWIDWKGAGVGAGAVILGGIWIYYAVKWYKKRGR